MPHGKFRRIGAKIIPRASFFWLHYNPSVTASPRHLPLHKGGFGALYNQHAVLWTRPFGTRAEARPKKGSLVQRELSAVRLTEGLSAGGVGILKCLMGNSAGLERRSYRERRSFGFITIPPSRLRRATSLCTREALARSTTSTPFYGRGPSARGRRRARKKAPLCKESCQPSG